MKIPGTKQTIDRCDIDAVAAALNGDYLTTGPGVAEFETAFAEATESRYAIAVNSGTAALHASMFAAGIGERSGGAATDEVIVPAISFVATANVALYQNAKPVFADLDPDTLLIDLADVERKITPRTKAIIAMDYGGQPCDYIALRAIADRHGLLLVSDACHSLGGRFQGRAVGSLADMSCFSLHPAKQITTLEGGMVTTDDPDMVAKIRAFRNHGITTDHRQRQKKVTHRYSMESLGHNYRLSDVQCALGQSQLKRLSQFTAQRNLVALTYDQLLQDCEFVKPLRVLHNVSHARHLYVVHWDEGLAKCSRDDAFESLRRQGIGANVHYRPIYDQPFYQRLIEDGTLATPQCPVADFAYQAILSLPIFPNMTDPQIHKVVNTMMTIADSVSVARNVA